MRASPRWTLCSTHSNDRRSPVAASKPSEAHRTTVEKTSDREVVVTRTFNAPARLVFQAWSDPELFRKWWVPRSMGMTLRSCEMDVRTGGKYRLVFGEDPANTFAFFGTYLDVAPDVRIVWTNEEGGDAGSVTAVTLEERDGRTLLVMRETYPTREALDQAGTGAQDATHETFAQLDALLAELAAG
ncbi:MAG: ATPase [Lysobacteraceae bacterium]|nr:MAG: ATPase [Xanthomonadaceae bacterium]